MSNVKKPNQHLESVPEWWEFFVARFVEFGALETEEAIFNHCHFLSGYVIALNHAYVLTGQQAEILVEAVTDTAFYHVKIIITSEGF